jgi:hypothetical protein
MLALWNALPGIEKQTKVGDRDTLIDQLWSAIEALSDPEQPSDEWHRARRQTLLARSSLHTALEPNLHRPHSSQG